MTEQTTDKDPPVLSFQACLVLNMVKLVHVVKMQPRKPESILDKLAEVVKGVWLFPGECNFRLKTSAVPVTYPPRHTLQALRSQLKDELDKMERSAIICKVSELTDWINALVIVEKPRTGKHRICLDTHDLSMDAGCPYLLSILEDITAKLTGVSTVLQCTGCKVCILSK